MLTKIHNIKFNHVDTDKLKYSLWSIAEKTKGCFLSKRRKMQWNHNRSFFKKSQELAERASQNATFSEHSIAIHSNSIVGYITAILVFVHAERRAREVSSFCDFWKTDLLQFHCILLLFYSSKHLFLEMCLIRRTNLCPIRSHFHALDFSECPSEEVMFLLKLSVYQICGLYSNTLASFIINAIINTFITFIFIIIIIIIIILIILNYTINFISFLPLSILKSKLDVYFKNLF